MRIGSTPGNTFLAERKNLKLSIGRIAQQFIDERSMNTSTFSIISSVCSSSMDTPRTNERKSDYVYRKSHPFGIEHLVSHTILKAMLHNRF
jgi:hypothetical protein